MGRLWSAKWRVTGLLVVLSLAFVITSLAGCGGGGGGSSSDAQSGLPGGIGGGTGTATLSWVSPATNTDGSPVTLMSFRVYVGTSPANLQSVLMVTASDTTAVINGLAPGTYYFAVTAISATGAESAFSNIGSKIII
jgi:hypothetical protein